MSTGFCFEEVTRDVALRDFDSEMPGNQCDPTSRVLVNSAVCTEFRRRAPSQLETLSPARKFGVVAVFQQIRSRL